MASSRRSRRSSVSTGLAATVAEALAGNLRRGDRIAVGLSGGIDSVVLLDVLVPVARAAGLRLSAIHVNHQLSPNARRWAAFCGRLCAARRVPLTTVEVSVPRGNSLEAAARAARYCAFDQLPVDAVVLAHNQDDQAETLLLQLLRGAGVRGLAGMPAARRQGERRGGKGEGAGRPALVLRPLLGVPRSEILAYARARRLKWIEDESNADVRYARNFLRHEVLPRLGERFPAYRDTLARSARHLAEAADLLNELAAADAAGSLREGTLAVAALARLSEARARNLLRWFLAQRGLAMPNAERLAEALRQAVSARADAAVCVDLGAAELRRHAGALHVVDRMPARNPVLRQWRGEARLALPALGGTLTLARRRGAGLDAARLAAAPVTVRSRRGGERLRPAAGGRSRSLKNLMQEANIPPWVRDRLPLLYCGDTLVWVPGVGMDEAFAAAPGRQGVWPSWKPAAPALG